MQGKSGEKKPFRAVQPCLRVSMEGVAEEQVDDPEYVLKLKRAPEQEARTDVDEELQAQEEVK